MMFSNVFSFNWFKGADTNIKLDVSKFVTQVFEFVKKAVSKMEGSSRSGYRKTLAGKDRLIPTPEFGFGLGRFNIGRERHVTNFF